MMETSKAKKLVLELRDECVKLAEEEESRKQEKCAQLLLAAAGLTVLQKKLGL